jgi:hypothetical protein
MRGDAVEDGKFFDFYLNLYEIQENTSRIPGKMSEKAEKDEKRG